MKLSCLLLATFLTVVRVNGDKFDFETFTNGNEISKNILFKLNNEPYYNPFYKNWPNANERGLILSVLNEMINLNNGEPLKKEFFDKSDLERSYQSEMNSGIVFFPRID